VVLSLWLGRFLIESGIHLFIESWPGRQTENEKPKTQNNSTQLFGANPYL